jgi:hypothetical protein
VALEVLMKKNITNFSCRGMNLDHPSLQPVMLIELPQLLFRDMSHHDSILHSNVINSYAA